MIDISYHVLTINCPSCQFSLDVLGKQVMAEEKVICAGCLSEIQLKDNGSSFRHAEQEINNALESLMKSFK